MFENSCYYSFQRFHIKKEAKGSILFCIDWFFLFGCFFKQKNIGPQTQLIKLILSTAPVFLTEIGGSVVIKFVVLPLTQLIATNNTFLPAIIEPKIIVMEMKYLSGNKLQKLYSIAQLHQSTW